MNDKDILICLEEEIRNGDDGLNCSCLIQEWLNETPEQRRMIDCVFGEWSLEIAYNLMFGVWTATLKYENGKASISKKDAKELATWIMEQFL